MHTNVILTNKRYTHAQSNYTNTKLKAWFRRLLSGVSSQRNARNVMNAVNATNVKIASSSQ